MRGNLNVRLFLAGVLIVTLPVGAWSQEVIEITDSMGAVHEITLPLDNVVVINRNTAEAIQLLGVQDRVIATGDTTVRNNVYLDYGNLPDVGETGSVNLELLLELRPEAVFAYTNRPDTVLEDVLTPVGIPVIRINNYLPERFDEELRLLAELFSAEARAEEFLDWKQELETLAAERVADIPEDERREVLALSAGFLNSNGGYRIFPSQSLGGSPGVGEGYATILAGGVDAADVQWDPAEASTTILVDEEYVLSRNPEIITLHGTWLGGYQSTDTAEHRAVMDNVLSMPSIQAMQAGQNDDIYFFHTNIIGSDKRYIGVLQLAKYLYPERFEDIDPDAILVQYFERWLEVPYQGVWHYAATDQ